MRAQAYDDRNVMDIPVEWAFGAGGQAVTFVTRIDKDCYLEHFYSYYSVIDRMAADCGAACPSAAHATRSYGAAL